jgi:hypothetical protein
MLACAATRAFGSGYLISKTTPLHSLQTSAAQPLTSRKGKRVALNEIEVEEAEAYFCQVRFLCRLARSCLRRLCLLIFALRRFFSEPIWI